MIKKPVIVKREVKVAYVEQIKLVEKWDGIKCYADVPRDQFIKIPKALLLTRVFLQGLEGILNLILTRRPRLC